MRRTRQKALRKLHDQLATLAGAQPSKLSWRRVKRAHLEAVRLGYVPQVLQRPAVGEPERM